MRYIVSRTSSVFNEETQISKFVQRSKQTFIKLCIENDISEIFPNLRSKDTLLVSDATILGRKFEIAIKNIIFLSAKHINFYLFNEDTKFSTNNPASMAELCLKVYKSILSAKNSTIQQQLKSLGRTQGRPRSAQSRFDDSKAIIVKYLQEGKNLSQISRLLQCSRSSLYRYILREKLEY